MEPGNSMLVKLFGRNHLCVAVLGFLGVLSFFSSSEEPETAMKKFVIAFKAQDAAALLNMTYPEIVTEKDVKLEDVQEFLKRYKSNVLTLTDSRVDARIKSEDGSTERFQCTMTFSGPVLAPAYPNRPEFRIVLLWISEDGTWWLERPISMEHVVQWVKPYPTAEQNEMESRFRAVLDVLNTVGMPGEEDKEIMARPTSGKAVEAYKELERLYPKERVGKGIDPKTEGVQIFLKAANVEHANLLQHYQPDFKTGPEDKRPAMPWEMFADYAQAAIERAKAAEKQGNTRVAESIYRRLITFGRQILNEPGGARFLIWGISIQKRAAEELARIQERPADREKTLAFIQLAGRRLDLLQTALSCLDDMVDYKALSAAAYAASRPKDHVFRPLGISTLAIMAIKGAPANEAACQAAGGIVILQNRAMQKQASEALEKIASQSTGSAKSEIEFQKEWVKTHRVFGGAQLF
jgi:tetratricopeptide (TPR) repeat protein